jgi:hypothetical protein
MLNHENSLTPIVIQQALYKLEDYFVWSPEFTAEQQALDLLTSILLTFGVSWNNKEFIRESIEHIKSISPSQISKLYRTYIQNSKLNILLLGNLTSQKAMKLTEDFQSFFHENFSSDDEEVEIENVHDDVESQTFTLFQKFSFNFANEMKHYMLRLDDLDINANVSSYLSYFQDGDTDFKNKLMIMMIAEALSVGMIERLKEANMRKSSVEIEFKKTGILQGLQILIYGRNIRPIEVETVLDKALRDFIFEVVPNYSSTDLRNLLTTTMDKHIEFQNELEDVMEKTYQILWANAYTQEKQNHYDAADKINLKVFSDFVHKFLISEQNRITIEIFEKLEEEQKTFKNESANLLGDIEYEITTEESLYELMKERNGQK